MREKNKDEKINIEYSKNDRLIMAVLTALSVSFTYFFYGPINIYSNNKAEFIFTFKDFILPITLAFIGAFIILTIFVYLHKSFKINVITAAIISLFISGIIDNNLINKVVYTSGDASPLSRRNLIIFFVTYFVIFYATIFVSVLLKEKWKSVLIFLCVLLFGSNAAVTVSDFATKDLIHDTDINCNYVASEKGLYEASDKENIIVILFDRMDTKYYDSVVKKYPDYFDNMKGFTLYDSATTTYSRTFPAVSSLITNKLYLNDVPPEEYFKTAYSTSPFMHDLKKNGYNINLYIDKYYEYTDAEVMKDYVDNVEPVTDYKPDTIRIWKHLTNLSLARNFSYWLSRTSILNALDGKTADLSTLVCDDGIYHDNDEQFYKSLKKNGLSPSGNEKDFKFIYLHGSHTPIILGENCEKSDNATIESQTIGSFKIVFEYLEQLKKLGVYDNSTIIITADHGFAISDFKNYFDCAKDGITACMFVKPRGAQNEKLITSSAEASITNLVPAIVQDAKLKTNHQYAESILNIKEGDSRTRTLYQSVVSSKRKLILNEYEIKGNAKDLSNWKLKQQIKSDFSIY